LNFLDRFSKNIRISNFIKIRPLGAELFGADGQKDKRMARQSADWHDEADSRVSLHCEST